MYAIMIEARLEAAHGTPVVNLSDSELGHLGGLDMLAAAEVVVKYHHLAKLKPSVIRRSVP